MDRDRAPAVAGETPPVAVSTVLVGTGGYGAHYLAALREGRGSVPMALVGAVDPRPEPQLVRLLASEAVPVTSSLDAFFAAGGAAELAVIASPIHWHVPQSVRALASGCHVFDPEPRRRDPPSGRRVAQPASPVAAPVVPQRSRPEAERLGPYGRAEPASQVAELEVAERRAGRWVRVGYQWAYAAGVQALKRPG